jgi:hypothetical protein
MGDFPFECCCVKLANFLHDPVRKNIDLVGVRYCNKVNAGNNCKFKKLFDFKSFNIKKFIKNKCKEDDVKYHGRKINWKG